MYYTETTTNLITPTQMDYVLQAICTLNAWASHTTCIQVAGVKIESTASGRIIISEMRSQRKQTFGTLEACEKAYGINQQ